ncbi:MAG: LytTR family DNA-binding domain-containing protein [Bacteroidales bacterium]|nr:LytTR family DNA-binding domain-containing protein [Bacteroidales bacterium]
MEVIIVEDEKYNVKLLEGMLNELRPTWTVSHVFDSIQSTVQYCKENKMPDLIFMDIQLIDDLCFSIFEQVEITCPVIFTTAFDEYAIQAFKVMSVDYLLKPLKEADLAKAVSKFEKMSGLNQAIKSDDLYKDLLDVIRKGEKKYRTRFLIQGHSTYSKLDVDEIAYFYSENKITFAVTFAQKEHIVNFPLEQLESELSDKDFFRLNRKYIANIKAIQSFEDFFGGKLIVHLTVPMQEKITISRLKNSAFKEWMGK